ncbi:hypothetical protein GCM10009789_49010 [Kribbella sancticallisti]|uniref:Lipoprotein n=1 Tax=Kribbella sancticallisti TaxID=460087 RepID=A0ABP4PYF5_9ACTN
MTGAMLVGCSLKEQPNPDPRAYAGSAADVTLEKALVDNGIKLPEDAGGVRFAVYIGADESFDLTFDTDCDTVPQFLKESSIEGSLKSSVLLPSLVETAGREHGWNIESHREPRGIEDDRLGAVNRSVIVAKSEGNSCKVFVSAIR